MIYLKLFLSFLKIGAVSFGGGYGMIPLIRDEVLSNGWLSEQEFLNFIAVSESTPGPLAVNMATFIGSSQGGIWGALLATLGVVMPAFIIIILIAAVLGNVIKFGGVQAALRGIRPATVALVLITALLMLLQNVFAITTVWGGFAFDWKNAVMFAIIAAVAVIFRLLTKKKLSPIILIAFSAILGIMFFAF